MKPGLSILASAGVVATFTALPTTAAEQAAASRNVIEEVVVTARYREESVQDSPLSVTAFNEVMLEKITAQDLRDVAPATPNVRIQPVVTFNNSAAIAIRGMGGQDIESTNEMRTGISVNGVFTSRPIATLIDFFDVESVQILRGPQGTTFGKNSLAGGIAINTVRPDGTVDYKGEVTVGNYGRQDARAAVQFPLITDKLAMRISGLAQNYDGHFENRVNGDNLNGENLDTIRTTLVYTPTENLEATLIYNWLKERSSAPGGDNRPDPGQLLQFKEPDNNAFRVGRDALDFVDTDQDSTTVLIDWRIGEFTLHSVTGWIGTNDWIASDFDQTEVPFFPTFRDQVHDQFSQEIRLQSDFSGRQGFLGNLDFVVGLFYFEQEHELTQAFPTLPGCIPFGQCGAGGTGTYYSSADYTTQDGDSRAVFGQAIYAINERLNVTLGLRYTEEEKDFKRNIGTLFGGADLILAQNPGTVPRLPEMAQYPFTLTGDFDRSATTAQIAFDYRFTDDILGFVSFNQGYKAGEFGARANLPETMGPTDDETADSYEIGVKSEWLDGTLRANATLFHTKFEDLQFGVFIPSPVSTGQETLAENIGESTNQGAELELLYLPIDGLTLQASIGYLDAEYDEFCADINGAQTYTETPTSNCGGEVQRLPNGTYLVDEDQTWREMSRAPDWQYFVSADYEWQTSMGWWFVRAAANYESDFFTDGVTNNPIGETGDFWLVDGAAGWRSSDESWRIQLWCKNCGDKTYTNGLTPTANFFNQHFYGWPRTYGLTLAYSK
jgi:iron complex outermembrane recepter protein